MLDDKIVDYMMGEFDKITELQRLIWHIEEYLYQAGFKKDI